MSSPSVFRLCGSGATWGRFPRKSVPQPVAGSEEDWCSTQGWLWKSFRFLQEFDIVFLLAQSIVIKVCLLSSRLKERSSLVEFQALVIKVSRFSFPILTTVYWVIMMPKTSSTFASRSNGSRPSCPACSCCKDWNTNGVSLINNSGLASIPLWVHHRTAASTSYQGPIGIFRVSPRALE